MAESNVKEEKHIVYDAIKIGLASPSVSTSIDGATTFFPCISVS